MPLSITSRWRIKIIYIIFVVTTLLVIVFLFRWQILENDRYKSLAKQRIKDTQLSSLRGTIHASDGSSLAYSLPVYDVYVYLPDLIHEEELFRQTRSEFISKMSQVLSLNEEDLHDQLESGILYIKIGQKVSVEKKDE